MFLDNASRDWQSQPGARPFGREERFEDATQVFRRNAFTAVADDQLQVTGVAIRSDFVREWVVSLCFLRTNGESSLHRHGINRIQEKVYESLLKLIRVAFD